MPPRPNPEIPRDRTFVACALVFCATIIAYIPALKGGFLWNDSDYVTQPALRSLHGLWRIWFDVGATEQYYPLLHSAFWLEHRLWGDATLGYHLVNVLLHATSACLFGLILRRLWDSSGRWGGLSPIRPLAASWPVLRTHPSGAPSSALERASVDAEEEKTRTTFPGGRIGDNPPHLNAPFLAALIFALHPVCVESVAWISEEKNTLSTMFYLAAALTYFHWRGGRRAFYFLATLLFLFAILSKSVAATLPAALLVVLWWKQGRLSWRRDVLPLLPWFALSSAAGLFTGWVERKFVGAQGPDFILSFAQRCLIAGRAIWFYFGKLLWPGNLIFIYPRWRVDPSVWWQWLFPLGILALVAALWVLRHRTRGPLAALLLFGGSLFPILGFFNIYAFIFSFVADHFQYLASLSVIALLVAGYGNSEKSLNRFSIFRFDILSLSLGAAFPIFVVLALGALTWRQSAMYRDRLTFYQTILEKNPDSWMAQNNLGIALAAAGRLPEAIEHYQAAVRIKPTFPDVHNDLGAALLGVGRAPEALEEFRIALGLQPAYAAALGNLGDALMQMGRTQEAVPDYQQALRLKPNDAQAHNNLGIAFSQLGRNTEAADQFAAASRLQPDNTEIRINLGTTLAGLGRMAEARIQFEKVLRLKPDDAEARESLAHLH